MKWIGQHIWDLTAKFRSRVYLESTAAASADPDKFLGLDGDNQIVYRSGSQLHLDIMPTDLKVLPHQFMSNEDGGQNKSVQFDNDGVIGVRTTHNDAELFAFVEIPRSMQATTVTVHGNDSGLVVAVYKSDINAGALTQVDGGCTVGSACTLDTKIVGDATSYMVIEVRTADYANDIVYGAAVTIEKAD